MLNVARLKILKEVAYRGSFSAAAEALDYSQSAVSQQIAALESETGLTLLERHPRGVSLTAAGQTLVRHAEGILARLDAAESALAAIAGLRGGRLWMASFPTAGATLMPLAIATFRGAHPRLRPALRGREPPAGLSPIRLRDLRDEAWVQPPHSSPCARHVVRSCHAAGFEPNVSFESDDYQTAQGLVAAGVGVALIPALALSVVREG